DLSRRTARASRNRSSISRCLLFRHEKYLSHVAAPACGYQSRPNLSPRVVMNRAALAVGSSHSVFLSLSPRRARCSLCRAHIRFDSPAVGLRQIQKAYAHEGLGTGVLDDSRRVDGIGIAGQLELQPQRDPLLERL